MIEKSAKKLFLALAAAAAAVSASAPLPAAVPSEVQAIVSRSGLKMKDVALWIAPAGSRQATVAFNEARMMEPASVMKIVTTAAALELLTPAWTSVTRFGAAAEPDASGRIHGAVFIGGGDSHFVVENVWLMAERLSQRGVKSIEGDIVVDRSRYDRSVRVADQGAFDGAATRPYNVGPDPAVVNFKTVSLTVAADGRVTAVPALSGIELPTKVRVVSGACGDWKASLMPRFDGRTLRFQGTYPAACGEKTLHYSGWDADAYVTALFRRVFAQSGIRWSGRAREGRGAADVTLAEMPSAHLSRTVAWINKFSNNAMARQLFLELGLTDARGEASPATLERSRAVVRRWLEAQGVRASEIKVDNGSGLSRTARVSARALGEVLSSVWTSSVMPEFMASLPSAGVDGTMRKRPMAAGSAHLKTGFLRDARSLAGYVTDREGRRHVFVMLVNSKSPDAARKLGDELIAWTATHPCRTPCF